MCTSICRRISWVLIGLPDDTPSYPQVTSSIHPLMFVAVDSLAEGESGCLSPSNPMCECCHGSHLEGDEEGVLGKLF